VERANRTHTEEFCEVTDAEPGLPSLGAALAEWEHVYNTVQPHQALGYLTPAEYLASLGSGCNGGTERAQGLDATRSNR
jgi:transposase InsO family protein